MKTTLPNKIKSLDAAKKLLMDLYCNGESFHPEDDATELLGNPFTKEEGEKLNGLMNDIYCLPETESCEFDPCEFLLELNPEYTARMNKDINEMDQG